MPQNESVKPSILLQAAFAAVLMVLQCAALPGLPQTRRTPTAHLSLPPEERIDINHATVEQLMKAPGMTHVWAERIVRFRPYHAKSELIDKGVLPGDLYNRIKDCIIAHHDPQ